MAHLAKIAKHNRSWTKSSLPMAVSNKNFRFQETPMYKIWIGMLMDDIDKNMIVCLEGLRKVLSRVLMRLSFGNEMD